MSARSFAAACGAALLAVAGLAHAGGPLGVCSNGTPMKYSGVGNVVLNYDQGTLGARTNAQAAAIVTEAVSLWTNVATSTVSLTRGGDLPVDVTAANVNSYWNNFSDAYNPVIYDTDGTIIDTLFGAGMSGSILGVAGSANSGCTYVGGRAVINGRFSDDVLMKIVVAHEVGHLIGLDHTQIDNTQGLVSAYPSNYPLMYPIAYRDYVSLHEDDAAAITSIYPDSTAQNSTYGQVSGMLTTASGTAVRGANVWAQSTTGATFSVVSDYLQQGTGYFKLLLLPGTYTLHAEAISASFTDGSSVGPYSETSAGLSFQAPLYNGSTPMAPVTLGGSSPTTFTITAGCAATATFRLDGTGSVTSSCVSAPSTPSGVSPSGTITTATPTYTWNARANTATYNLRIQTGGTTVATLAYSASAAGCGAGTGTCSVTPSTTLTNGTSYTWSVNAANGSGTSAYSASIAFNVNLGPPPPAPVTVSPSGTITTSTPTYVWNAVSGATSYWLLVQNLNGVAVNVSVSPAAAGCSGGTGTCSYTPSTALAATTWGWYVNASNAAGTSAWSDGKQFTVNTVVATIPAAPTTVSPTGTITTATPTYVWNAVSGATSYWLLVQNLNGVGVNVSVPASAAGCSAGTGTCSYTPSTPLAAAAWGWYVNASNSAGTSAWSAGRQFTVNVPSSIPAMPTLVSPTGTITTATPTYVWNASAGATSYWLLVQNLYGVAVNLSVSATTAGCAAGTGTCSYTPSTPLGAAMWGWYVNASNAYGTSGWSAGNQFTVSVASSVPAAPTQVAPAGTIGTSTPTYTWNASSGATSYWLLVQNLYGVAVNVSVPASSAGCGAGTGTCSYTPAGALSAATWGWYVSASNAYGTSPWSAGSQFVVSVAGSSPPPAPTLVGPVGTIGTTSPSYTWNASAGASSYRLLVQNLNGGAVDTAVSASAAGCSAGTGTCSYNPGVALSGNTAWGWFVNATNGNGTSAWSSSMQFRTP